MSIQGPNPGNLKAYTRTPARLETSPALVVVLHGCTQTAAAYDAGSGWSLLADRHGFIVLYPEQQAANNPGRCFNWYGPEDVRRGHGEVASIRAAIETVILEQGVDRSRVFITGLSAGGAMTSAMLATYPEVFAGGAVIAGLPYAAAASIPEAFDRMRGHGLPAAAVGAAAVRVASGHSGPWPSVSVWHGDADHTVASACADALVAQWAKVHDLRTEPDETRQAGAHTHRLWHGPDGDIVLEDHRIAGMGHGVPVDMHGPEACGGVGPYFLEAGLSATLTLVEEWKLAPPHRAERASSPSAARCAPSSGAVAVSATPVETVTVPQAGSIQEVIEDALRRAGLMR